jgi:hypothetical protein
MILDCVLTACNTNPKYIGSIPMFIKSWKKILPHVHVKIILIAESIPENISIYTDNIILFHPINGISTAFMSQYIRLLYPAMLDYKNGIIITDVDMIPMNNKYYTKSINNISDDKFIYMRNVLLENKEIAMCYNVATNKTWCDIFKINTIDDIKERIISVYKTIVYVDGHGQKGWATDQFDLYKYVMEWNKITNNLIILNDNQTGFNRLNRGFGRLNDTIINDIKNGIYSDYHCYVPYSNYKEINDTIVELL